MTFWRAAKDKLVADRLSDEHMHALAVQEIDSGRRRDGLWAKAVLAAGGEERRTKVEYLRLLVRHLKDEEYMAQRVQDQDDLQRETDSLDERQRHAHRQAEQAAESLRRELASHLSVESRKRLHQLVAVLRERDLNFDQYKELATLVGAAFGYHGLLWGTWQIALRDGRTIDFRTFDLLRPWFVEHVLPLAEA